MAERQKLQEQGSSLVGAMVALAILGISAAGFANIFNNSLITTKKIEDKNALEDLRKYIRLGTHCARTIAALPKPCLNKTAISILRPVGTKPLVELPTAANRTKLGSNYLRAECTSVPNEIRFIASKYPAISTKTDQNLFAKIPFTCPL